MKINCPHGWKSVVKLGNITWEDATVEILEGICDSPDRCGIKICEYFDTSPEATRIFCQAQAHKYTLDGLLEKNNPERHLQPRPRSAEQKAAAPKPTPAELPLTKQELSALKREFFGTNEDETGKFDEYFDELLEKGFIEPAGCGPDREPQYRLTKKALAYADCLSMLAAIEDNSPEKIIRRMASRN